MDAFLNTLLSHPDFALLLSLPLLAALMGGLANWLGWRVLFGGLPLKKWPNGILGERSSGIARELGERLMSRVSLSEYFHLMEPERIATRVTETVMMRLEDFVDEIMMEKYAVLWSNLPVALRQRMYARVRKQLPALLDNLVDDIAENVDTLTDIPSLLEERLGSEPSRFNALLEECLKDEKRFLLQSGVLIGLLVGGAELALFTVKPLPAWTLSVLAIGCSILAYWLPRRMLFHPVEPVSFGKWTWQGRIYRQPSKFVSLLIHQLVEEVLNIRILIQVLLSGSVARRTRTMIRRHLRPLLDAGLVRTTIQLIFGARGYADVKQLAVDRAITTAIASLADVDFNQERSQRIDEVSQRQFQDMTPAEQFRLLHSVMAEEEWLQYVTVIATGFVFGMVQWAWMIHF